MVTVQLVSVGVPRGVGAVLLSRADEVGCARTARQRRPQRALRAEGALEPVGKVLTLRAADRRCAASCDAAKPDESWIENVGGPVLSVTLRARVESRQSP